MRRLPYQVVLYVVATLAFASVAMAQQVPLAPYTDPCSGVAEQFGVSLQDPQFFAYVPEVDGCVLVDETAPVVGVLNGPVFNAQTGESLGGLYKDLVVDLDTSYETFCGALEYYTLEAQQYFEQTANAQEQAILDPNGDGLACTAEDEAFLGPPPGAPQPGPEDKADPCFTVAMEQFGGSVMVLGSLAYNPDANLCVYVHAAPLVVILNNPAYDADTGENLGLMKNVDPTLGGITHEQFCGEFPIPDVVRDPLGGLTAQQYYEQVANAQEQAILDPNGDGLACTAEDAAFLPADTGVDGAATDDGAAAG